ncbi:diguanylate cyclase [Tabrizicola thermarum]|uniref:diguanylate cyclase n=1 Tax=Tabrizicola thermarum TaxID=2670345 RepID=UPI000FFC0D84|nr:diguanylate cyclase [Tabrizicola thermarum]
MSARILIVDDIAGNRIVQQARLAAAFYESVLAADGASCLDIAQRERPDLILLDLGLPDISGLEVLQRLRRNPACRDMPVIALTANGGAAERLAAFAAGADDVMDHPANERVLLARLRNLLRLKAESDFPAPDTLALPGLAEAPAGFEPQGTIALVTPPHMPGEGLRDALAGQLRDRLVVLSRREALAELTAGRGCPVMPEVFVLQDDGRNPSSTLRLLSELKSHQATRHAAVCVVGPAGAGDEAAMAFDLGADDAVGPGVTAEELVLRTRGLLRRKRHFDQLRARMQDGLRLAMRDPLTGLYNRRFAVPQLALVADRARAEGSPFAVMVMDLDRFKEVNDLHGHAAGDQVLVEVARRLTVNLRDTDILARIGGEEFLAILPRTGMATARRVAERLCRVMDDEPIRLGSGEELRVTVSIGVAVAGTAGKDSFGVDGLVEQADIALLESKGAGRNQVTFRLSAA